MRIKKMIILGLGIVAALSLAPACSRKSGCPANESLQMPVNRKGELKSPKKRKSGLFPKKMNKKMHM